MQIITKNRIRVYLFLVFILVFFSFVLYFYLRNITHDVYAGDIGDIATAAALFGVPHPPGYPTITFLGFLFSKLPLPIPIISRISLVSVAAAVGGLIIYFRFILDILHYDTSLYRSKSKKTILYDWPGLAVCILSTAILGFSYYYWLYAEVPEVFALNNFFIIAMYYTGYLFYKTKNLRYFYLTSFIVGLSMTNQQAIMFAFPGVAVLLLPELVRNWFRKVILPKKSYYAKLTGFIRETKRSSRVIRNSIIAFFVGLLPYVYIFISASTNPQINWMKEPTIYNFIRLILRMDYTFGENLVDLTQRIVVQQVYFSTLTQTYSLIFVIVGCIGLAYLFVKEKRILTALLIGFLFAGPVFMFIITPEIIDPDELGIVERMFVQSFVLFAFFLPYGFLALQELFYRLLPRKIYGVLFLLPFFIVTGQMIYYNAPKTDLANTKIGSNFVYDILGPLHQDSLVFLIGDSGTLNSWFAHYVEGYRPDIVFAGSYGDRNDFERQLVSEYRMKNKQSKLKDEAIIVRLLPEVHKARKIYSMYQFPLGRKDYMWVPRGLVFELMPVSEIPSKEDYFAQSGKIIKQYHIAYRDKLLPSEQNNIAPYMSKQYSNAFNYIGDFLYIRYADRKSAFGYYATAQMIDPQNPLSYAKMGIVQAEMPGQCGQAVKNIDKSIEMYKIYRPYYAFALRIYNKCNAGKKKIDELNIAYKNLFGKDLEKNPHY